MSLRIWWLLPLLAAACTGLYFDRGNAFPCDFSQGPGVRDEACVAGDVCGSDNLCRKYIYEGPRFEGTPTVPTYGAASGQGATVHPLVLKERLTDVALELPYNRATRGNIFARNTKNEFFAVTAQGNVLSTPPLALAANTVSMQPFQSNGLHFLFRDTAGEIYVAEPLGRPQKVDGVAQARVRFVDAPDGGRFSDNSLPLVLSDTAVGLITLDDRRLNPSWVMQPLGLSVASGLLDVAGLRQPKRLWLATLTNDALSTSEVGFSTTDAGTTYVVTPVRTETLAAVTDLRSGELHTDREGRIITALRRGGRSSGGLQLADGGLSSVDVLSTWQVTFDATGPVLTQAWPDCQPCQRGQQVEVLSASVATGAPLVEVICGPGTRVPTRIVGSVALTQTDACRTERFEAPVPISRVGTGLNGRPTQWDNQTGLLFGGSAGEIWQGDTISTLEPLFLDRVPRDVAPSLPTDAQSTPSLSAIAHDYLSVLQTPGTLQTIAGLNEQLNGFRRIDPRELGVSDDQHLLGLVHGTPGWGVTSTGDVVRTKVGATGLVLDTAGRVVASNGSPIRDSIGGEAFVANGVLTAIYVAADDGLYFLKDPRNLVAQSDVRLTPELIPEPSVPIRSLALERTPLGTNGTSKARGYLVTSRNVYAWELSGTPGRWSARPLSLGGGEPLEVWFDSTHSALGRVGFIDGEIDSLPGGYQLVESLPSPPNDDGGTSLRVLDYENLGGWPVAYASTGLFIAGWDLVDGKLDNRFPDGGINKPMSWRKVTLPDGTTPWMNEGVGPRAGGTRDGKLFVASDPVDDAGMQDHRLLLFLDDRVLQVAHHLRHP